MSNARQKTAIQARGFTLIEMMIVLAVIAVLAAIAFPSYQEQVRKSRRSDGHAALTRVAQQLERCFTVNGAYNQAAGCDALSADDSLADGFAASPEGNYTLTANTQATTFTLVATPANALASMGDPECPRLTFNQQGQRGVQRTDGSSNAAAVEDCW